MADFQNRLISRIFGVFSNGFLHRTTLMFSKNGFRHVFGIFNFRRKLTILHRIEPLQGGRSSKSSHLSNIFFLQRFFAQKNSNVLVECFSLCFWHF